VTCSTPKMKRVAIGAFTDPTRLEKALGALLASSIEPIQLCLIGTADRLAALDTTERGPAHWQLPPDRFRDLRTLDDGEHLVAAAPALDTVDLEPVREPRGLLEGLEASLAHGAIALMVSARTVSEFAEATRVLLRYGSYRVRTREVAEPLG